MDQKSVIKKDVPAWAIVADNLAGTILKIL